MINAEIPYLVKKKPEFGRMICCLNQFIALFSLEQFTAQSNCDTNKKKSITFGELLNSSNVNKKDYSFKPYSFSGG